MKNKMLILTVSAALGSNMLLSGCIKTIDQRGYLFDEEIMDEIRPGVDNRSSVSAALGTPTMRATFDEETWYYIAQTKETFAFFKPETTDQEIVVISFNDRGDVSDINRLDLEDSYEVDPVGKETPTRGKELGFFEQIFSNIGRFSSDGPAQPGY